MELQTKQWPGLLEQLLSNMAATDATDCNLVKTVTLEALGYICEELQEESVDQLETNQILTAIVDGMREDADPDQLRSATAPVCEEPDREPRHRHRSRVMMSFHEGRGLSACVDHVDGKSLGVDFRDTRHPATAAVAPSLGAIDDHIGTSGSSVDRAVAARERFDLYKDLDRESARLSAWVGALAPGEVMVELEQAVTEDVARYAATGAGESYFGSRIQDLVCARGAWLAALLVLQSASSVVLGKFEGLLQRHLALALFLTMLTGTAGNAGNQTSALVIRGLATGEIRAGRDWRRVLWRETRVALPLSIALGLAAFGRVVAAVPGRMAVRTAGVVAFATTSTILAAILVGVGAPLLLDAVGVDPCNCASPALATAVDLLGVVFLCVTGQRFLK